MSHKHRIGFLPLGFCVQLLAAASCDRQRIFAMSYASSSEHDSISTGSRLFIVFVSIQYVFSYGHEALQKETGITAQHCHIKCTWACAVTPRFVFLPCFLKPKKGGGAGCYCHYLLHVTRGHDVMYIFITWFLSDNYWDSCTCNFHVLVLVFFVSGRLQKLHQCEPN